MPTSSQPKKLAPWKIRLFGLALVLFGGLLSAFSWAALQRPDLKMQCQYDYTADPACKKAGVWGGLAFLAFGLPILLAPRRWLDPDGTTARRRQ